MGSQYCPSVLLDFTCQSTPRSDFPRGVCHSYSLLKPPNLFFPPHSQFIENLIFPSPNLSVCLLLYPHILCFLLLKWMNSLCSFSRPVHFLLPPKGFCPSSLKFFLSSASFPLVYKHAETWPAFFKKYEEKVYLPFTPYHSSYHPFFCLLVTAKHLERGICIHSDHFFLSHSLLNKFHFGHSYSLRHENCFFQVHHWFPYH